MGHTQHHKTTLCVGSVFTQTLPQNLFTLKTDEVGFLRNADTHHITRLHISTDRSLNIHGLEI